jgi:Mg-chelatase subunit ChlD
MEFNSDNSRLCRVDGNSRIAGDRILVPASAPEGGGTLIAWMGHTTERTIAVRVVPDARVPNGIVVIPESMARELDLHSVSTAKWRLNVGGRPVAVKSLYLEAVADLPIEEQIRLVQAPGALVGRLLLRSPGDAVDELNVKVGEIDFRVVDANPLPSAVNEIQEITNATRVRLISSGEAEALDVVILADTSGSMYIADLFEPSAELERVDTREKPGRWAKFGDLFSGKSSQHRRISRIAALQRAIIRMIEKRTEVSGRGSRFALLRFYGECEQVFPPRDGMVEIDEFTDRTIIEQFRRAVGMLELGDGTNIGLAIYRAFDLLHRHFKPGRRRLIVLVSDGANAPPTSESDTGREIDVIEDPVRLLRRLSENLSGNLDVKLLAIGISDEENFDTWLRGCSADERQLFSAKPAYRPNHGLLTELMAACGAERPRPGHADDLLQIFSDLGAGVSEPITLSGAASIPELSSEEAQQLQRVTSIRGEPATPAQLARIQELDRTFRKVYLGLTELTISLLKKDPFEVTHAAAWLAHSVEPATDPEKFASFSLRLYKFLIEGRPKWIKYRGGAQREFEVEDKLTEFRSAAEFIVHPRFTTTLVVCRNFFEHFQDADEQTRRRFERLLQQVVGSPHIADDETARWIRLQEYLLEVAIAALTDAYDEFRRIKEARRQAPSIAQGLNLPATMSW